MSRAAWNWARLVGGATILVALGWRVGAGPFLDGIRTVDGWSILAAVALTAVTTVCSAWRWTVVADGLGAALPLRTAIAAYYRSQFLNSALPGGVLGDVHRGVHHGRGTADVGRGLRAVVWERTAGLLVQLVVAVAVLTVFASPVRSAMPLVVAAALVATAVIVLAARVLRRFRSPRREQIEKAIGADVGHALFGRRAWWPITVASLIVVAGHASVFLIAARTVGVDASLDRLLPLTMLALVAMSVPLSIGGWGPREGVTAWAFGAAGLGVDQGITTATAYGVMAFVATLPGAGVLIIGWMRRDRTRVPTSGSRPRPSSLSERPRSPIASGASRG